MKSVKLAKTLLFTTDIKTKGDGKCHNIYLNIALANVSHGFLVSLKQLVREYRLFLI